MSESSADAGSSAGDREADESDGGALSADTRSPESSVVAPNGVPVPVAEDMGPVQAEALSDGVVTLREYQVSFDAFEECAGNVNLPLGLVETDPVTGLISYGVLEDLLPVSGEGGPLNDCYIEHFSSVERVFQLTDPTVLAVGADQNLAFFEAFARPCLEALAVPIPAELDGSSAQLLELLTAASEAFDSGRCERPTG